MADCEEIVPRLAAFVQGEIDDCSEIESHLADCSECSRLVESYRKVANLTLLDAGLSPGESAWDRFEARISRRSGPPRHCAYALAAAALIAAALFIYAAGGRSPELVGTIACKYGSISVAPFSGAGMLDAPEGHDIVKGDTISTGRRSLARIDIAGRSYVVLGGDTEVSFPLRDLTPGKTRIAIRSGKAYFYIKDSSLHVEAGDVLLKLERACSSFLIRVAGNGHEIFVRSGRISCIANGRCTFVEPMQKLVLNSEKNLRPSLIENKAIFDWVVDLLPPERQEY